MNVDRGLGHAISPEICLLRRAAVTWIMIFRSRELSSSKQPAERTKPNRFADQAFA
jgi:hypothetical protein